jgi:hypothetical protein
MVIKPYPCYLRVSLRITTYQPEPLFCYVAATRKLVRLVVVDAGKHITQKTYFHIGQNTLSNCEGFTR